MPCAVRVQAYIWSLGARPSPSWWRALEAATWSAPILPQRQQQQQQHSSLPQVEQRGSFSFAGQHSSDCQVDQHSSSQHRNLHGRHGSDWAGAHTRAAIAPGTAPPRRPALFPYAACHVLGSMALAGVHVYKGEGGGCHVLSRVWARHMPHKGRDVRGRCMALAGACVCSGPGVGVANGWVKGVARCMPMGMCDPRAGQCGACRWAGMGLLRKAGWVRMQGHVFAWGGGSGTCALDMRVA